MPGYHHAFAPNGPLGLWLNQNAVTTNNATINHGNFVAPADGTICVLAGSEGTSAAFTGITIGGVSATLAATASASRRAAYAYRAVSAGTHAITTVQSGAPGASGFTGIGVWFVPAGGSFQSGFSTGGTTGATSRAIILDYPVLGLVMGMVFHSTNENTVWPNFAERCDVQAGGFRFSCADLETIAAASAVTESPSWATSTAARASGISWRALP